MSFALVTPALADVTCVQDHLTKLGFDPGPVDGALGKKTVTAATLFAANAGIAIETLENANSAAWCEALTAFAATPEAKTISRLDLVSEPEGILSQKDQERLWDAYTTVSECMDHPSYGKVLPLQLSRREKAFFTERAWVSPFTNVRGAAQCEVSPGRLNPPAPIPKVTLDEEYGERQFDVDTAAKWFRRLTTYVRYADDPIARTLLKQGILDWAKAGGLGSGIHLSYAKKPVDYQMATAIAAILAATAELAADFSADERAVVGDWLGDLVAQVAASQYQFRTDNKMYMDVYYTVLWGLMIGDDKVIQDAIFAYKLAIHDMRPDGSWPIDSQRSGMGLVYGSASTGHLVATAIALKEARGIDLFSYSVDGRSIHDAVAFIVAAMKDPGGVNSKYAIACGHAGDRWGSIAEPNLFFIDEAGSYLLAYAARFPDRESSAYVVQTLGERGAMDSEKSAGAPACQYALLGGEVDLPPLAMPAPLPDLPEAKIKVASVIDGEEANVNNDKTMGVYLNLRSGIVDGVSGKADGNELNFNIVGTLNPQGNFSRFSLVLNAALGEERPKGLVACGAKTDVNEAGKHRLVLNFDVQGDTFTAEKLDCILDALPKDSAFQARFVTENFAAIAIGLVANGDVDGIETEGMRTFFKRAALGEIVLKKGESGPGGQVASIDATALPAPELAITTVEKWVKNQGKAVEIVSLLHLKVKGAKKGKNDIEFNLAGNYAYPNENFLDLMFVIQDPIGKEKPASLAKCPGARTEVYDGQHHAVIKFKRKPDGWEAMGADCIIANIPERPAYVAKFLLTSFRDVAIGLVSSGEVNVLENDGLRTFITKVAQGTIVVH